MRISIIVPVLEEAAVVAAALAALAPLRAAGHEVVVVDGGSRDGTPALAEPLCDRLLASEPGRARQMNAGAAAASGEVLLFLHADTRLPAGAARLVRDALARPGACWGRFDARLDARHPLLRVVQAGMNLRSRLTGIATGDQAMFVRAACFRALGGFPEIALMEDVALSARLRRVARPSCLRACAVTSARRWLARGIVRTIVLMWWLRLAYALGVAPERLARWYRPLSRRAAAD